MTDAEKRFLACHDAHDVEVLLTRWEALMKSEDFRKVTLSTEAGYPVVGYRSTAFDSEGDHSGGRGLYFCAGVHGDEPAGPWGLLRWAESRIGWLARRRVCLLPCFNPWGLVNNRRTDAEGRDLNRLFHRQDVPLVAAWHEFVGDDYYDVALHLHEDYDARGTYVYELTTPEWELAETGLAASDAIIPRERRSEIEGNEFRRAILRRTEGMQEAVEEELDGGYPEAIYVFLHHARAALTFETPSEYSLWQRIEAQAAFLDAVVQARESHPD